ncbi:MAG: TonB family protein [Chitinophagaceae bacterium]|jgi:TonB family protein
MKKRIAFLIGFFCFFISKTEAQTSTVYFDKNWDTCPKRKAYYTRVLEAKRDSIIETDYYPDGKIHSTTIYRIDSPEIKNGYHKYYAETGLLFKEGNYKNGKEDGLWKCYRASGALWFEEEMKNGVNNGYLKAYYPNGALKVKERYENGNLWEGKRYGHDGRDTTFYKFKEMPEFVGGSQAMYEYLTEHIVYPPQAFKKKFEGKVTIKFAVDTDGSLIEVHVARPVYRDLDKEALRVVSAMPKWKPGTLDDKPIKIYFQVPIKFVLQ